MSAQGPHSDTTKLFNGTSLTGWKPVGAAAVARRERPDRRHGQRRRRGCSRSKRATRTPSCASRINARGVTPACSSATRRRRHRRRARRARCTSPCPGPDAMILWRVTLDAQGKELTRQNLYKWAARQNPPGMQLRVQDGARRMEARSRAGARRRRCAAGRRPRRRRGAAPPAGAPPAETFAVFGPAALRVNNGEIRVKDVLAHRPPPARGWRGARGRLRRTSAASS